jgi:hypothetical protein
VPGSHAATAEFFALFYQHCMVPTTRNRYLMEVANECGVKIYPSMCNTTWSEMIGLHIAVADALHAAHQNSSSAGGAPPAPLVCGPTAAFPEYQASDFNRWRANGTMADFLTEAGGHVDCFSVHLYDTFSQATSDPFEGNFSTHDGNNLEATLDLQEVGTALLRPKSNGTPAVPLPMLFSEYGSGMKVQPLPYSAAHDWWLMRGTCTCEVCVYSFVACFLCLVPPTHTYVHVLPEYARLYHLYRQFFIRFPQVSLDACATLCLSLRC